MKTFRVYFIDGNIKLFEAPGIVAIANYVGNEAIKIEEISVEPQ